MNEGLPSKGQDALAQREAFRLRLDVKVGRRGEFAEQIRAASRNGVEEVTPNHPGPFGLAMSQISPLSKRSVRFEVCSTLIPVGRGIRGVNLSFLTHQIPTWNRGNLEQYRRALAMRITDFMAQIDPRSATFSYFGGEYTNGTGDDGAVLERLSNRNEWHRIMRTLTAGVVRETAGREMAIVDRPNLPGEKADLFLDTEHAALYIERY